MTIAVRTTCPYCGVGCGVLATPDGVGGATIAGDPDHPANFGRLCSKGSALGETLDLGTRLLHPMIHGQQASWDEALDHIAEGFRDAIDRHGPSSVALYLSGQLLTEDYYVPNKFMKGFVGSANVDTNSRLCMSSSVAGHKKAFGTDTVPGCYEDLDQADLIVLVGSNAAWCHPILFQRMIKAQEMRGTALINIDVRATATANGNATQLSIAPGQDAALFSGLLVYLADHNHLDTDFIARHTQGFDEALARARAIAPNAAATALRTRLAPDDVTRFFRAFATARRVVTLYSQGVNQSSQGTDKVSAILNCHLATGRIGKPGMGPFSLTGQPNAMGGREVGGLANQLAAHMNWTAPDIDKVRRFWNAPNMAPGAGMTIIETVKAMAEGRLKALWVIGTNPAVSLPQAEEVRAAFAKLDLFVVSENVASNDTINSGAHVLLPATAWGEKDGTVTNSERRISRQRAFLDPPGEVKPDWWAISQVAQRLGFSGFEYQSAAEIFAEHAALSAFENDGTRDFDLSGLAAIDRAAYDALAPVQWPVTAGKPAGKRFFADGGFFTPSGKAAFIAVEPPQVAEAVSPAFPLVLNTGRVRDQWHTMTRTGLSPRLGSHIAEPFVAVHPEDARRFGVIDGGLARVANQHGTAVYRVTLTTNQERGAIFVPMHWNDETASTARTGSLVHAICDPFSGQPDFKSTPANLEPVAVASAGFMLARQRFSLPRDSFWAWSAISGGYAARIDTSGDGSELAAALEATAGGGTDMLRYEDRARGIFRVAFLRENRLVGALFLDHPDRAPKWGLLAQAWDAPTIDRTLRRVILSGKRLDGAVDEGPNVCACFGVPQGRITAAIAAGATSAAAIGAKLKAGTNCGSCIPELKRLIAEQATVAASTPQHGAAS
ncbi:MAG: molybdopterin-dependent oxidoreductase [Beijerinckiaceae bacterium]|nr:molybdopterin-dependent oxidoreductase [Beijerinckiaceae bacterium]